MLNNISFTASYCTPIQLRIPTDLHKVVNFSDPIYSFNEVFSHIDISKYIKRRTSWLGRSRYDEEKLMKVIVFAFMECGYASVRTIEKLCSTDIRFIWLLDGTKAPSYKTIANFLNLTVGRENLEKLFKHINHYIFQKTDVDLEHTYIDGTKIEANANKYSWVWKRSCITNRGRLFVKISKLFEEINATTLALNNAKLELRNEYVVPYVQQCYDYLAQFLGDEVVNVQHGKGKRLTVNQRLFLRLATYLDKLKEYSERIEICGSNRNSYSKSDKDATFMRIKRDYMGNDQLLPAYNMQVATCDEYIAAFDVKQFASDADCFAPLMNKFNELYGEYPLYPVADAGYGSYNNYLFCQEHNMGKYMKFTMFDKETKDKDYSNDKFRVKNFAHNPDGTLTCPNNKRFFFVGNKPILHNHYGRTEEIYECEDCSNCPMKTQCTKATGNRKISLNRELSDFHTEVLNNLNCVHGALLRMNRSIQSEGVFGIIKFDREYRRIKRRSLESVIMEFSLIAIGFNLYKYNNQLQKLHRKT